MNQRTGRYTGILVVLGIAAAVLLLDPWKLTQGETAALTGAATLAYLASAIGYRAEGKRVHTLLAAVATLVAASLTIANLI